jgi:hypothetical protein
MQKGVESGRKKKYMQKITEKKHRERAMSPSITALAQKTKTRYMQSYKKPVEKSEISKTPRMKQPLTATEFIQPQT